MGGAQTVQFLLALGVGVAGSAGVGLAPAVAWILGVSFGLSLITTVIEASAILRSPDTAWMARSKQNPHGIFSPTRLFAYLFFGTITTMAIPAAMTALLFGGAR